MKPPPILPLLAAALLLGGLLPAIRAADFTSTWDGSNGNWTNGTSWTTPGAPGTFPNNGSPTPTYDAIQNAGTLTVNQAITIENFTLSSGTLNGPNTLTLNGQMTFNSGMMSGVGTTQANGGILFTGSNPMQIDTRTVNIGDGIGAAGSVTASWTNGFIGNRGPMNVRSDAAFTTSFDGSMQGGGSPTGSLNIDAGGSFTKSGGTGTTTIGTDGNWFFFNNNGTVNTQTGTLLIGGAAGTHTHTGLFDISSGANLNLAGTHILNGTASVTGAGTLIISGTVSANGTNAVSTPLTLTGLIQGTGTLNANDAVTWNSGTMASTGTTNILTSLTLSSASDRTMQTGRVVNIGDGIGAAGSVTASHTAGLLNINSGSTLIVRSDAAFDTNFDSTIQNTSTGTAVMAIHPGGSFTKSGGSGTTSIGATGTANLLFHNNGTVNVQTGTLLIGSSTSTHTGTFNLSSGTTLHLAGTHNLNAGTTFTGAASTLIMSGTINANTTVAVPMPLTLTGTLQGTGTLNASGAVTWSSGTMTSTGTTNILASIAIDTAGTKFINSGRTVNIGDSVGAAGSVTASWSGGAITNLGPMNVRSDAAFTTSFDGAMQGGGSPGGALNIHAGGSFTKNGGTGTTSIGTDGNWFSFNNSGTVNVSSGTLALGGGAGTVAQHSGTTLTGGTWNVTNGASINITNGSNITTNGAASTVMLDGAGSSFNRLTDALNNNQGSFTIKNDRDLTTAGAYTNSGTTRVEDSTTVMTIGSGGSAAYTQTGGVTALVNGAFIDPSVFNLNGGTLQGTGTIESNVLAGPGSNTIAPGLSPGALTINGDLTLSSGSTLAMELGGLTQGTLYDYLDVNGVLTLAGMLDLDFINDFQNSLANNEILTLATANSAIMGSFSNVASGSYLTTNYPIALQVWYGAGSPFGAENLVVVIPEPSRALLMMLGGLALLQRRRQVRTATFD
ncbi:MAG: PEP-CTERM sorting domain-containing protein [Verrucomicrobiaceae bacterium]|nr:PEP-CTERM sorting domain-containing protein [Verrucomicrobiaceae bacterium]